MLNVKTLKDEVRAAGLYQRCEFRSWSKFFLLLSFAGGLLVAHTFVPIWASILLVPVTAWFFATAAMIGHEGSHRGLSASPFRNQLIFHLSFPVLSGISAKYWHWKHDSQHHTNPNVADVDPDILIWPMASTADEYRRSARPRRWFQRNLQGIMFWPLCFLLIWSMRGSTIGFLYRHARTKGLDRSWWADVGSLVLHICLWLVVPILVFGPWALALYVGIWTMVGIALSMVFAPAHIGMPVVTDPDDKWRLQFETTRNLKMPKWMSFFFIGLDHQVEHHIFTKIPHQNLAKAAVITKDWARRNDVPYHEIGYLAGLRDSRRFMANAWRIEPTPVQ